MYLVELCEVTCIHIKCNQPAHTKIKVSIPNLSFLSLRDRAVPANMEVFHDHGGQLCGFGWSAPDARSGIPLSRLAGTTSCHHLSPAAYAVLHLVRKKKKRKT